MFNLESTNDVESLSEKSLNTTANNIDTTTPAPEPEPLPQPNPQPIVIGGITYYPRKKKKKRIEYVYKEDGMRYTPQGKKVKRNPKDEQKDLMSSFEILDLINKIPEEKHPSFLEKELEYKALIAILYLTGARINEILDLQKKQIRVANYKDRKVLLIQNLKILKTRGKNPVRQLTFTTEDRDFVRVVLKYLQTLTEPEQKIFEMKRARAFQIVKKYTGKYPHYFRHVKNTHLVTEKNFSIPYLKKWNGWVSDSSASFYINLSSEDLTRKILGLSPDEKIEFEF